MSADPQELTEHAKLLIAERRYQEAVRACRRALLSRPNQIEIRLLLGEALLALERYDEVRVEMMALARKAPDRGAVFRLMGEAYLRDHRPAEAIEALERSLALDPRDEVARELLAEAAEDRAPVSTTIERWFADEAVPTKETTMPGFDRDEEATKNIPMVAGLPAGSALRLEPEIRTARPREPDTGVRTNPRARPPAKPTMLGSGSDPFAPPPAAARAAAPIASSSPAPRVLAPAPTARPAPAAPVFREISPDPEMTAAHRPSALKDGVLTDELSLDEIEDVSGDVLGGAPTNAVIAVPRRAPADDDEGFDEPTRTLDPPADATPADGPTRAHRPAPRPITPPSRDPEPWREPPRPPPEPVRPAAFPAVPDEPPSRREPTTGKTVEPKRKPQPIPMVPIVVAVVSSLVLAVAAFAGVRAWSDARAESEIRDAAARAGRTGARADFEEAIELIEAHGVSADTPEALALQARLRATLVLEHGDDREAAVRAQLATIPEADQYADAVIAQAILELHTSQPAEAVRRLSGLRAEGDQVAEAYRVRAVALDALGRARDAEASARQSFGAPTADGQVQYIVLPDAPRHMSLYALLHHRAGNAQQALALLDQVENGAMIPAVRLARARILLESGASVEDALTEATAVLEQLADRATPYDLAWARLVRARVWAPAGDAVRTSAEARAAAARTPPSDERFVLQLAQTFLDVGALADARTQLDRLTAGVSVDAYRRAILVAEVAIGQNDLERARRALDEEIPANAREQAHARLLRGELRQRQGQVDEAMALFRAAADDPSQIGIRARVRLAAIELGRNNALVAVQTLEPVVQRAPADLELVPVLVRAYLATNQVDRAEQTLQTALQRRPEAAELLAAQGAVLMRRGRFAEALASLTRAAQTRPDDMTLQLDLGDAARRAGQPDTAQRAFETVLGNDPRSARALVGLVLLAIDAGIFTEAQARLERATSAGAGGVEVARLRARIAAAQGLGYAALADLRPLAAQFEDAELFAWLGTLETQAEEDSAARRTLRRATDHPEALLALAWVETRSDRTSAADEAIARAIELGATASLGPAFDARVRVAQGRVQVWRGNSARAEELGTEALRLDPQSAEANLLLAEVDVERGRPPLEHLRAATRGRMPPPEAFGRLAVQLGSGEEACSAARRYRGAAPNGEDMEEVSDVLDACPAP